MTAPEVGALVEVTLTGRVRWVAGSGGFSLDYGTGAMAVPPSMPFRTVEPPRPREVMLLDCGHVSPGPCPPYAESIFCGRCQKAKQLTAVGSVTW